ncbi:MAG: DUF3800 domain-containing protein [Albidovulum sp.]|nr:DUF3800 domain-containing protein [Albidovulum sp.]
MSWLFFQDESGQDHQNAPLEVRGGVALHSSKVWSFVKSLQEAEERCFGIRLSEVGSEIKGSKLLDRKRFGWANQEAPLDDVSCKKGARRFLTRSQQRQTPSKRDFTAFGQASIKMAHEVFASLKSHNAVLFASVIPRVKPPPNYRFKHFLRKDLIFLQERFYWFLEAKQESGLLILDQVEKETDKRYLKRVQDYYIKTANGRKRSKWIVPYPLFVDSELSLGAQAADLCLYCINWGFRRPEWNFHGAARDDIHAEFAGLCGEPQYRGTSVQNGTEQCLFGIFFVPDPFTARPRPK